MIPGLNALMATLGVSPEQLQEQVGGFADALTVTAQNTAAIGERLSALDAKLDGIDKAFTDLFALLVRINNAVSAAALRELQHQAPAPAAAATQSV